MNSYDLETLDNINALRDVMSGTTKDLIPDKLLTEAVTAAQTGDKETIGKILTQLYAAVKEKSGTLPLTSLDDESFGKKIGWLMGKKRTPKSIRMALATYQRELARPLMETNVYYAYNRGLVKEVVRRAVGQTCPWCLERAGIWAPYDANAYGVWKRHAGCDCQIFIRWVKEEDSGE